MTKPKKKTARKPAVKEKRAKVISYEEIRGALPLGDLCIKVSENPAKLWNGQEADCGCGVEVS
jgi:hypothetical protein